MFADRSDGITVSSNQHLLARPQCWRNFTFPQRKAPDDGVLQALRIRQILGRNVFVLGILCWMVLVALLQRRRRDVEAAPPNLHLIRTMLLHSLLLVQASQAAIEALVQAPVTVCWDVALIQACQHPPASVNGSLQNTRVCHIEGVTRFLQGFTSGISLLLALFTELHVHPTRKLVLHVPLGFSVSYKHQSVRRLALFHFFQPLLEKGIRLSRLRFQ
mmetsp:Transcript_35264/g.59215  ORF Transcript_35264/g.59215 Transcript_35264/m.59215 type:complete len:217 (-) Transcript_35264:108-758(-)